MLELNLIERALASLAPEWGVRRLHAKASLASAAELARSFDAARRDRRTQGWRATGGSPNAEIAPALDLVRRRSRDLVRNNEWAGNFKRKLVAHMVGTGIVARPPRDASKAAKKRSREAWNAFVENADPAGMADFYGIQAQLAGEVVEGGAAFVRWYLRPSEWGLKVPLQCEVLPHEHLDTRKTERRGNNVVINGVEFDPWGRRAAYWLFPQHPGDVLSLSRTRNLSERVPASECDHVFRVDLAGQVTGVPWLASSALRLRDGGDYEEAEIIRKKIGACMTVFVRRNAMNPHTLAQATGQAVDPKSGKRIEKLSPGLITYLGDGEEIAAVTPPDSGDYGTFMDRQMLAAAAGVGLPYAIATGDLTKANFAGQREGKLDFWQVLDQWQWLMLVPQVCRPAWRRVMRASVGAGMALPRDLSAEWTMPKRPWVDPLKDVKAEEAELALGLDSWVEKVAARGFDPEDHLAEITAWRKKLEAAGVRFAPAPGIPAPARPAGDGPNSDKEKEDGPDADQ
ncbi:MAG: phage portal protein lambda family [Xanthobacteraceae bacterium]|jgi:lambda family phage portal protein|nr:phage portal protein lambda family [Xanthobacteraceae bacterium]